MIKLLHIVSSMDSKAGGVSQAVRTMIKNLSDFNIESEVASLDSETDLIQQDNFKTYALGPGKGKWNYNVTLLNWLKLNVAGYGAVIIHGLWQYHSYAVNKVFKTLKTSRPILYLMPHGMLDPYFQKAKGRKLKAIRNSVFWILVERSIINSADALLFTCEEEKLRARETFNKYRPKKEIVVGLAVETPPTFNNNMTVAFDKAIGTQLPPYLLFISRIDPKKGVDILIDAYLELIAKNISLPPLVIAGPGLDTGYGKKMKSATKSNSCIYFPGMLTGDAKWGAFYGCAAFILPSHQENFGIAVVEALACTKPVLISKQVNIWREIDAAGAGLVADDNQPGVTDMINTWFNMHISQKNVMGNAAFNCYEANYTARFTASKLADVLIKNKLSSQD